MAAGSVVLSDSDDSEAMVSVELQEAGGSGKGRGKRSVKKRSAGEGSAGKRSIVRGKRGRPILSSSDESGDEVRRPTKAKRQQEAEIQAYWELRNNEERWAQFQAFTEKGKDLQKAWQLQFQNIAIQYCW